MQSPVPDSPKSPMRAPPTAPAEVEGAEGEDDEAARRSNIAARMAKLGGVKFGAPPVPKTKRTMSTEPSSAIDETPKSPIREIPPPPQEDEEPREEGEDAPAPVATGEDGDETPEQEAARRRATLARLRAGGSLGFGMFGQRGSNAPASPADERGLEEAQEESQETEAPPIPSGRPVPPPQQMASLPDEQEEVDVPPPPPARPGGSHSRSATAQSESDFAPPVSRPNVPANRPIPPPPVATDQDDSEGEDAPPPPPRPAQSPPIPQSPVRRPSIPPPDRRLSQLSRPSTDLPPPPPPPPMDRQMTEEPGEFAPPPPARPAQMQSPPASPRRSTSIASRSSGQPVMATASRQGSRMDDSQPRASVSQNRPGFNELQEASKVHGAQLIRAAKAMFSQGKQGYLGVSTIFLLLILSRPSADDLGWKSGWIRLDCIGQRSSPSTTKPMGIHHSRTRGIIRPQAL
jgi:hypothetical protein